MKKAGKNFLGAVIMTVSALGFTGCGKTKKAEFTVVAASFPCYDAARACLGDLIDEEKVSLKLLIKPGAEVHSFDPSPKDMVDIQDCDVFIYIGGESDEWVERISSSIDGNSKRHFVKLIDSVETVEEEEFGEVKGKNSSNEREEDEHIWTSPENEKIIVKAVAEGLCKAYKDAGLSEKNGDDFEKTVKKNQEEYISQIEAVEEKTRTAVGKLKEKFIVMADRFPLRYFADFYGLEYDAAFSGCSTAVEASSGTIARLIDEIKAKGLKQVYYIELSNHKIADSVAEAAGIKAKILYSVQNVSKDDFDEGKTWVSLMAANAESLGEN